MGHWQQWAKESILLAKSRGYRESSDLVQALRFIQDTGVEPYHTVKGEVCKLENS